MLKAKKFLLVALFFFFIATSSFGQLGVITGEAQFWITSVLNQISQIQTLLKQVEKQERIFKKLAKGDFNSVMDAIQIQSSVLNNVFESVSNYSQEVDRIDQKAIADGRLPSDSERFAKVQANIEARENLRKDLADMRNLSWAISDLSYQTQNFVNNEERRQNSWEKIFDQISDVESPTEAAQLTSMGLYNISSGLSDVLAVTKAANRADAVVQKQQAEQEAKRQSDEEAAEEIERRLYNSPRNSKLIDEDYDTTINSDY